MEVISTMMDKYKINEQPTIIRDDPSLSNQFEKKQKIHRDYSIHEKLYGIQGMQESQVTETHSHQ